MTYQAEHFTPNAVQRHTLLDEQLRGKGVWLVEQAKQQMLGTDVIVPERPGFLHCAFDQPTAFRS